MAKKRSAGEQDAPIEADSAVHLRDLHALGREAIRRRAAEAPKSFRAVLRDLTADRGTYYDLVKKAARFAQLYDDADLDRLCRLRTPDGRPLSVAQVRRLVMVRRKPDRRKLESRIAREGLTGKQLDRELARLRGGKLSGGRKLKPPRSVADALDEVEDRSDGWLERFAAFWAAESTWSPPEDLDDQEAKAIRSRLKEVADGLARLQQAAATLEQRLRSAARRVRSKPGDPKPKPVRASRNGSGRTGGSRG